MRLSRALIASALISSACSLDPPFLQEEFECTQGGDCPFQLVIDAPFPSSTYTTHAVEIEVNGEVLQTCQSPSGDPGTAHSCTLKLPQGTQVLLRPSSPGWFFGWSEGCEGQMECELSITQPTERAARFAPKGKLEIEVLGDGRVTSSDGQMLCGGNCSFPFEVGARTTLTAAGNNNGILGTWCEGCSGDQDCTLIQSTSETESFQRKVQARFSTGVEIGVTSPCEEENVLFLDGISNTCEGAAPVPFAGTAQGVRVSDPTNVVNFTAQSIWMAGPSPSPEHPGDFTVVFQQDTSAGLVAGRYLQATGVGNRVPGAPVMHIRQNGESTCTNLSGRFEIKSIEYSQDSIRAMLVTFSQTCELTGEVISGCINYAAP